MKKILSQLINGWNVLRVLRIAIGVLFINKSFEIGNIAVGILGGFFIYMAIANVGCFGSSCAPNLTKRTDLDREIEYEEIK